MATKYQFEPDFVSPPGESLEDVLEERGMTQAELSERTGLARKTVNEIIKGKAPITHETAIHLERVLDIPASFWNAREQEYREAVAREEERVRLQKWLEWLKGFPLTEMASRGLIEKTKDKVEQLREVLGYFGVASPERWAAIWLGSQNKVAFRKSLTFASSPEHMATWLRHGEVAAREMDCAPFDEKRFRSALKEIRGLTRETPQVWQGRMVSLCCAAGVAVVFTPQFKQSKVCGATRWLSPDLALIQLSLRYRSNDHFWFTFFHEAAHILLHGKREVFLEKGGDEIVEEKEREANEFAARFLVPPSDYARIAALPRLSKDDIEEFARQIGVAPGVVVGQLQHNGDAPPSYYNALKERLDWA